MIGKLKSQVRLYMPHARPFLPHAGAILFIAFLGWANGYFQAVRSGENLNLKETWSIPSWAPFHAGPELQLFSTLDIWDGVKPNAVAQPQASAETWQFVGTVRTGKTYAAVILLSGKNTVQRKYAGEVLPNGEKIISVEDGTLQLDVDGTAREVKLFEPKKK
jgi:hypothetical protein